MRVPNFIILGAQKAGTTSLYLNIGQHPQIFMSSPIKEPSFFFPEDDIRRKFRQFTGLDMTDRSHFLDEVMLKGYGGEPWFGDASTTYTYGNASSAKAIPERIKQLSPDAYFVFFMRNPIDRIVSHFLHWRRHHDRAGTFDVFLQKHGQAALRTSLYWQQISPYMDLFPRERFFLGSLDDLAHDTPGECGKIFNFLGLEEFSVDPRIGNKNPAKTSRGVDLAFPPDHFDAFASTISDDLAQLEQQTGFRDPRWRMDRERYANG